MKKRQSFIIEKKIAVIEEDDEKEATGVRSKPDQLAAGPVFEPGIDVAIDCAEPVPADLLPAIAAAIPAPHLSVVRREPADGDR